MSAIGKHIVTLVLEDVKGKRARLDLHHLKEPSLGNDIKEFIEFAYGETKNLKVVDVITTVDVFRESLKGEYTYEELLELYKAIALEGGYFVDFIAGLNDLEKHYGKSNLNKELIIRFLKKRIPSYGTQAILEVEQKEDIYLELIGNGAVLVDIIDSILSSNNPKKPLALFERGEYENLYKVLEATFKGAEISEPSKIALKNYLATIELTRKLLGDTANIRELEAAYLLFSAFSLHPIPESSLQLYKDFCKGTDGLGKEFLNYIDDEESKEIAETRTRTSTEKIALINRLLNSKAYKYLKGLVDEDYEDPINNIIEKFKEVGVKRAELCVLNTAILTNITPEWDTGRAMCIEGLYKTLLELDIIREVEAIQVNHRDGDKRNVIVVYLREVGQ